MEKVTVLEQSPLFEMLSPNELQVLAELSKSRTFKGGEFIFEEGEIGDSLFVLATGEVEVLRRDAGREWKLLAALQAPDFFGEMSLIDREYRSASVRAKSDTTIVHLTAENFAAFRRHSRDGFAFVIINIARILSVRLREANIKLAAQASR